MLIFDTHLNTSEISKTLALVLSLIKCLRKYKEEKKSIIQNSNKKLLWTVILVFLSIISYSSALLTVFFVDPVLVFDFHHFLRRLETVFACVLRVFPASDICFTTFSFQSSFFAAFSLKAFPCIKQNMHISKTRTRKEGKKKKNTRITVDMWYPSNNVTNFTLIRWILHLDFTITACYGNHPLPWQP